jgi:cytochrome c oxidase subunit 2
MRHFIIVGVLVIAAAFGVYFGLTSLGLMPAEASVQAVSIDWMWNLQVIAMSFLFALIMVPILYSLVVFKRKKGDTTDAEHIEGNTALEVTWTVIPLIVVVAFAYLGAYSLGETRRVDPNAMVIKVTARQWSWSFDYPDYGVVSKELYLPAGKQVLLKMESSDVIHSFWVPEFRVKQDVVPGRVTEYRITPNLPGTYKVMCAEICGTSHAYMESSVEVVSQKRFDDWIAGKKAEAQAAQTPEGKGQLLVTQNGCAACHSIDGSTLPGPTWQGLFGSNVELADGTSVTADEAFLAESIKNPPAKIVKGFQNIMPPFDKLTDEDIANIIAYIKTLK